MLINGFRLFLLMCVCWCGSVGRPSKRTIKLWSKSVLACLNKGCILFPGRGDFSSTLGSDQMTKRVQKTRLVRQEGIIFTVDGQTCETEDASRQNCALCLCEIMRTSTSGQTLFVINVFFFFLCVKSLGSAKRLRLIITRQKLWSGEETETRSTAFLWTVERG